MTDTDTIRARIERERSDVLREMASAAADREPVELDQSRVGRLSRMDALQGQQMAVEVARRRERRLAQLDASLSRLAAGEYGICVECHEAIAPGRLELDVAALRCIRCA